MQFSELIKAIKFWEDKAHAVAIYRLEQNKWYQEAFNAYLTLRKF